MPNKTKQDYLDLPVTPGDSQSKVILDDAVANKGINPVIKSINKKSGAVIEVVLADGVGEETGTGSYKAEAIADAAGKF